MIWSFSAIAKIVFLQCIQDLVILHYYRASQLSLLFDVNTNFLQLCI